ncbi:MAG: hypothetical protein PHE88_02435 [Elusimicrobia bacterium]|nr:hypothetical protein [Elusimicrobiota bacterium]
MNCKKVKKLMVPLLEGDLSGKCKEKVEVHINACIYCKKERELISKSWQILDSYVTPKLNDGFTASLMQKIHSERTKIVKVSYKTPKFIFWRLVPALASFIIMVFTFSIIWKRRISKEQLDKINNNAAQQAVTTITDEDIIRNLDLYENTELLKNYKLVSELEVVESLDNKF